MYKQEETTHASAGIGRKDLLDVNFLLNSIPGAVVVYKLQEGNAQVLYCSSGIERLTGWTVDEFLQIMKEPNRKALYEPDEKRFALAMRKIWQTRQDIELMYRTYGKDNEVKWIWMQGHITGEENGAPIMEAILLDITKNTNMYSNILDEATAMMTVIDVETCEIMYANKSAIDATKDKPGEYVGSTCYEYIAGLKETCNHCPMRQADPKEYHERVVDYGGRTYRQLFKFITWNDRKALLEYSEDITDARQNIKYAKERQNALQKIINNIPAGVLVFRIDGGRFSIIEANNSVCKIMGMDREKALGADNHNILQFTHPDDVAIVMGVAERLRIPGSTVHYEYRNYNKNIKEYVWVSGDGRSVLQPDGSVHAYISFMDITQQRKVKELEEKLQDSKNAAQAKAEFYSRMSHDMRTPMNGILGLTQLAEKEDNLKELHEDLIKIRQSGRYMLSLINDTLDLQRIETGRFQLESSVAYSADIIREIITIIHPTAKAKGVELIISNNDSQINWYVKTDAVRIKQILINLLSNAIKFTPEGGTVTFTIEMKQLVKDKVKAVFKIKDTGIGMSKEFMEDGLYVPFSQEHTNSDNMFPGSGLGLSIVKNLVDLMGGNIEATSEPGEGTCFTVTLDMEQVNDSQVETMRYEKSEKSHNIREKLKGKRILLCEDHPLNAEISRRLLEKAGCIVVWARDGLEGVNLFLQSSTGYFDAILMDIRMPVLDGLSACRQIRKSNHPDAFRIPIIAMSANAYEGDKQKSLDAGMNVHLAKPVDADKMYEELAGVLKK